MKTAAFILTLCCSSVFADSFTNATAVAVCGSQGDTGTDKSSVSLYCDQYNGASASVRIDYESSIYASAQARGTDSRASAYSEGYVDLGWFRFFGGSGQGIAKFHVFGQFTDYGTWSFQGGTDEGDVYFTFGIPVHLGLYVTATATSSIGESHTSSAYAEVGGIQHLRFLDGGLMDDNWYHDNINVAVPEPSTIAMSALGLIGLLSRYRRA